MTAVSDSYVLRVLLAASMPVPRVEALSGQWRRFSRSLFDPYRPERHYMRGPGPKWRERHARAANPWPSGARNSSTDTGANARTAPRLRARR